MIILPGATIGIIGGGQLGKMLAESANRMGYRVIVLDPSNEAPAISAAHHHICADFDNELGYDQLFQSADLVTYEFENINSTLVEKFQKCYQNIPQGALPLYLAQNRKREKKALVEAGLPVAPYLILNDPEREIQSAVDKLGFPFVVKSAEGGYDGKGQVVMRSRADLPNISTLAKIPSVAEAFIDYDYEASIIGTRAIHGEISTFPIAINWHINNILHRSIADPKQVDPAIAERMRETFVHFMQRHDIYGILAMEVFVKGEEIYINELAPRPHNSGHFTIEGCATSQFEQHIRAITGLPLGNDELRSPTVMYNILGQDRDALFAHLPNLSPKAHLHLYGKREYKKNRKMGHITFIDPDKEDLQTFEAALFNRASFH